MGSTGDPPVPVGDPPTGRVRLRPVAQAFQPAGSRNFPVPRWSWRLQTGDSKVPSTRRQECLRYRGEKGTRGTRPGAPLAKKEMQDSPPLSSLSPPYIFVFPS